MFSDKLGELEKEIEYLEDSMNTMDSNVTNSINFFKEMAKVADDNKISNDQIRMINKNYISFRRERILCASKIKSFKQWKNSQIKKKIKIKLKRSKV